LSTETPTYNGEQQVLARVSESAPDLDTHEHLVSCGEVELLVGTEGLFGFEENLDINSMSTGGIAWRIQRLTRSRGLA
jgi:hypothetical protein